MIGEFSMFIRCLLVGLTVDMALYASLAVAEDAKKPVPSHARLSLEFDKKKPFLGENVLVHFVVENVGKESFTVEMGGDYRGSPRALRFSVEAFDAAGKEVPDPYPNPDCMGGLSYGKEVKPGEKFYESLALTRYRRFD